MPYHVTLLQETLTQRAIPIRVNETFLIVTSDHIFYHPSLAHTYSSHPGLHSVPRTEQYDIHIVGPLLQHFSQPATLYNLISM